jgi:Uma2 family endonuclease
MTGWVPYGGGTMMSMPGAEMLGSGPFRADQLRDGDPYELSDGHPVYCAPGGERHGGAQSAGAKVLDADPAATGKVGVEVGYAFGNGKYLRAPDLSVGTRTERQPGWAKGAPLLAVEYADAGQDEKDLERKILELFMAGTRLAWVVRLVGPLRVEVHEPGQPMRTVGADEVLTAPGILQNPVPVRALVDAEVANQAALRNLLSRRGYDSIEDVQARSLAQSLLTVLESRGLAVPAEARARIEACRDPETLLRWIASAATAPSAIAVFG